MPNLGDLLSSLVPGGPVAPSRRPGQDESDPTTAVWEQSRGHRSQSRTRDAQDD